MWHLQLCDVHAGPGAPDLHLECLARALLSSRLSQQEARVSLGATRGSEAGVPAVTQA